jgi:hypothetical protein
MSVSSSACVQAHVPAARTAWCFWCHNCVPGLLPSMPAVSACNTMLLACCSGAPSMQKQRSEPNNDQPWWRAPSATVTEALCCTAFEYSVFFNPFPCCCCCCFVCCCRAGWVLRCATLRWCPGRPAPAWLCSRTGSTGATAATLLHYLCCSCSAAVHVMQLPGCCCSSSYAAACSGVE